MRFHFHFYKDELATRALAGGEAPALFRSSGGRKRREIGLFRADVVTFSRLLSNEKDRKCDEND